MYSMISSPLYPPIQDLVTPCKGGIFKTLGYRRFDNVGKGVTGIVVQSMPPDGDEMQAVKMLSKRLRMGGKLNKFCFENEVLSLSKIEHKHVVKMIKAYECPDKYVITMPYYSGGNLTSRLQRITCKETDKFMLQLTSAIVHLHTNAIAHKDIKPDNILISSEGDAVLADFGFACSVTSELMTLGRRTGTRAFVAPEILHGHSKDKINFYKCDTYSLGIVFWCMVVRDEADIEQTDHLESLALHTTYPGSYRHLIENLIVHSPEKRWNSNQLVSVIWSTWPSMGYDLDGILNAGKTE